VIITVYWSIQSILKYLPVISGGQAFRKRETRVFVLIMLMQNKYFFFYPTTFLFDPFSTAKNLLFYHYAWLVYTQGESELTPGHRAIAGFWDCNPFARAE
jgi:hypothetical protein